ncbi:MAG TPA: hypothetical protein VFM44_02405 [Gemmatimonadota bacterium]|nr:hypothetical protein [Gemmatimonadota bacterium]
MTRAAVPRSLALAFALFACEGGPTEIQEIRLGGELALTAYEGLPLPVDLGPLPQRDGGVSDCHFFVDNGFLTLDPDFGVFDVAFEVHACDGHVLSRPNATGVYWIEGDRWRFLVPAVAETEPDAFTFEGRLVGSSLVVTGFADELEFSGQFVSHTPRLRRVGGLEEPLGGVYSLVELNGAPVDYWCGFLIMEPDYRVYEMGLDSCAGQVGRSRRFGVYGQTGDRLDFVSPAVAEHGQDVVFSGQIESGRIRLVDPGGRSLGFANVGIFVDW